MAEQWRNGLCSHVCGGDCGTCLGAWCCSPCLYGRSAQRLKRFPDNNKDNFSGCNGECWLFCCVGLTGFVWIMGMLKRGEVRDRFNIEGNCCKDCLAAFCCGPCELAQVETELKDRALTAQATGSTKAAGYQAVPQHQQMQYQPPPPQNFQQPSHQQY